MVSHSHAHFPGLNRAPLHRASFPTLDQSHQSFPSLVLVAYIRGPSPTLSLSRLPAASTYWSVSLWRCFCPVSAFCCKFYQELGASSGKASGTAASTQYCPHKQRWGDLPQMPSDAQSRHSSLLPPLSEGQPRGCCCSFPLNVFGKFAAVGEPLRRHLLLGQLGS